MFRRVAAIAFFVSFCAIVNATNNTNNGTTTNATTTTAAPAGNDTTTTAAATTIALASNDTTTAAPASNDTTTTVSTANDTTTTTAATTTALASNASTTAAPASNDTTTAAAATSTVSKTNPGECVGKRGQPECDDKDKNTCGQLAREGKCKWLPAPKHRKTPTGDCLGEAECIGKTRRVCHRMRKMEGKCHFKPAPENTIEINTTIKGVKLKELDETAKAELKKDIQETIAEAAKEEAEAVNVTLSEGSVVISAVVDLEERIGIMEGEKEGQDVNLVNEMESLKGAVKEDLGKSNVKNEILTKTKNNKGVKEAAQGEITITDVEAAMTAPAATKAPTETPVSTTPAASSDNGATNGTSENVAISGAVTINAFSGVLFGSVAALVVQ